MKPGHVGEEQQRDVERVAGPDEARRLVGGVDEQHAALVPRLVGDDRRSRARRAARSRRPAPSPSARGPRRTSPASTSASISSLHVERLCSRRPGRSRRSASLGGGLGGGAAGGAVAPAAPACRRGSAGPASIASSSVLTRKCAAAGDARCASCAPPISSSVTFSPITISAIRGEPRYIEALPSSMITTSQNAGM